MKNRTKLFMMNIPFVWRDKESNEGKDTEFIGRKQGNFIGMQYFEYCGKSRTFMPMSKDTRLRIIIILSLLVGYVVVAILRSGTAW